MQIAVVQQLIEVIQRVTSMPASPYFADLESLSWNGYHEAKITLEAFDLAINLSGKRVLDLGCGLGGKTVYYAEQEAEFIVGVDISEKRARIAKSFVTEHSAATRIQIVIADASRLPFRGGCFDQIISTDTWEHLRTPSLVLEECERAIKMYGDLTLTAMPYFSPWGAHAWLWLPLPWLPSLLPRWMLFKLIAYIDRRFAINDRLPDALQLDWTDFDDPGHARRLTVAALERSIVSSKMMILHFEIIPVGNHYGGIVARLSNLLTNLPLLREILTGIAVVIMCKVSDMSKK